MLLCIGTVHCRQTLILGGHVLSLFFSHSVFFLFTPWKVLVLRGRGCGGHLDDTRSVRGF